MSIIDDALKKTQDGLDGKAKTDMSRVYDKLKGKNPPAEKPPTSGPPPDQAPAESSERPKPKSNKKMLIFLIVMLVCAGLITIFSRFSQNKIANIKNNNPLAKFLKKSKNKPKTFKKGEFVVSGVMKSSGKMVALINGKIYETGQSVQGKEIVSISMKEVQLNDNGNTIILPVKN